MGRREYERGNEVYIYLNGELIPSEQAQISIFDHGYLYGVGLFETFRTYHGHPFLIVDHLERLAQSCQQVGLLWLKDEEQLREQVKQLLAVNQLEDGYFRYNLSAGIQPLGLVRESYHQPTEALFVKELPPKVKLKELHTLSLPRSTPEGPKRFKSHHYLNNMLAYRETPPLSEGIFLTREGFVAEGIVSNLFFVRAGQLYTPSLSTGILEGITRKWVLRAADLLGISTYQGEYALSFAQEAEEVFITNSIQEIVPVSAWDGYTYEVGEKSVTKRLQEMYTLCQDDLNCVAELQL